MIDKYSGVAMKRRFITVLLTAVLAVSVLFAASDDITGKIIQEFTFDGLKHITAISVDNITYPYKGRQYSDSSFLELVAKLYDLEGVMYIDIDSEIIPESGNLSIRFTFHEIPVIGSIKIAGNVKLKDYIVTEAITSLAVGQFIETNDATLKKVSDDITELYRSRGFDYVEVVPSYTLNEEANTVDLLYTITEGNQKKVLEIAFEGNEVFSDKVLRSKMSQKTKSLFNNGYLDESAVEADLETIQNFYFQNGYIDAKITDCSSVTIEPEEGAKPKAYEEVRLVITVDEGKQWFFGGLEVTGNTVFSDAEISKLITLTPGDVDNLIVLETICNSIAELYWDNGYVYMQYRRNENRDGEGLTVSYSMTIAEYSQASVSAVVLSGITKSKEYVFRRELTLKEGEVFSRADLQSSFQNLYNTGLLTDLTYNIVPDQDGKGLVVQFNLTEGNQMDLQFGATFGGNVSGFPISGFLQWNNRNLFGTARTLSLSTTLSPDTQSVSASIGNNWFGDKRWSNTVSAAFSRSIHSDGLQLGIGSDRDDGKVGTQAWPLGYSSYEAYRASGYKSPESAYLMKYNLLTVSLGYSTGYTFVFTPGRLTLSSGISVSLNKAVYDKERYNPYEELIFRYGQDWQFSNKLSLSLQWDGRDYIYYTTKGYILSQNFTYAGGVLGGLSNYIKSTTSAAGYLTLLSHRTDTGKTNNLVLCMTSTLEMMLPQYYKADGEAGWAWHPASEGATKYEMLYIDGMTNGRGFDVVYGLSFLWDNMLEVSYPLVRDLINFEVFSSATAGHGTLEGTSWNSLGWWFAAGAGIKLKITGFPIGLYLVKNATFNVAQPSGFAWDNGSLFGGMKLVLAISTSLI